MAARRCAALACLWERFHPAATHAARPRRLTERPHSPPRPRPRRPGSGATGSRRRALRAPEPAETRRERSSLAASRRRDPRRDPAPRDPADPHDAWWLTHLLSARFRSRSLYTSRVGSRAHGTRANGGGGSGCAPRSTTSTAASHSSAQTSTKHSPKRRCSTPSSPRRSARPSTRSASTSPIRDPRARRSVRRTRESRRLASSRRTPTPGSIRGRWLRLPGLTSTLPLGLDPLARPAATRTATSPHCLPLTSGSCGSPEGLILGSADPGGTLERIDPFDRLLPRRVTLALGPSGGGKTVLINVAARCVRSRRECGAGSSTAPRPPTEHGRTAGTGHYDMLLSLIPGSRRVQVGSNAGE